jgi:quercetin dioxygenase-like cupin family protein
MNRRAFVYTSLLSFPAFAFANEAWANSSPQKALVIKAQASRFNKPTPFQGKNPNDLKLSSKDTKGKLSTFDYVGVEKVGPGYHAHLFQDEMFFVVEGEYVFQVGAEKTLLKTGDLIFLPRTIPHTWVQTSDRGQMFYFLQPAGKMEEFFLQLTKWDGKATKAQYEKLGKDSGIQNHGPSIAATDQHTLVDTPKNGFVVRAGNSRFNETTLINGVNANDIKVSGKDTSNELSIFEYHGATKGGPPLHVHPHQDEVFYVTDGRYLFQCGDEKFELQKGDMIFLPRSVPHTFAQVSDAGKLLFFFTPAGKMEDFFRAIGGNKPLPAGTDPFAAHDMKVVGDPLKF